MDWMDCVRAYPPEILLLKVRAKDVALPAAADFLSYFLVVEITPPALEKLGNKTYIKFEVLDAANTIVVWCFYSGDRWTTT
jgi:hypothetical protein